MITRSEDDSCAELHLHCSRAAALLLLDAVMNPHVDPIPGRDCSSGKLLAAIEVARDYKLHGATRHLMYQLCAADRGDMRFEVFVRACQLDVQLASVVLSLAAAGEVPNKVGKFLLPGGSDWTLEDHERLPSACSGHCCVRYAWRRVRLPSTIPTQSSGVLLPGIS